MEVCKNSLTVFGPKEDLQRFKLESKSETQVFSLNSLIEQPQELIEISKKGILNPQTVQRFGAMNINSWRYKNWGCYKNSFNSRIVQERVVDQKVLRSMLQESIDSDKINKPENVALAKDIVDDAEFGMAIYFETDESPLQAMKTISSKYPKVLFHFGFDSETEGVCGWVGLRAGEIQGHAHYNDCLSQIKVNVSPFDEELTSN